MCGRLPRRCTMPLSAASLAGAETGAAGGSGKVAGPGPDPDPDADADPDPDEDTSPDCRSSSVRKRLSMDTPRMLVSEYRVLTDGAIFPSSTCEMRLAEQFVRRLSSRTPIPRSCRASRS